MSHSLIAKSIAQIERARPLKIFDIRKAQARIAELSAQLNLPVQKLSFNIGRANAEIQHLEELLSARAVPTVALVDPTMPVTSPAAAPPTRGLVIYDMPKANARIRDLEAQLAAIAGTVSTVAVAARPSRKVLFQIASAISCHQSPVLSDDELFTAVENAAFVAHVRFPGMADDGTIEARGVRRFPVSAGVFGLAGPATRQGLVNAVVKSAPVDLNETERPSCHKLFKIARVFGENLPPTLTDEQLMNAIENIAFQNSMRFPGMSAESAIEARGIKKERTNRALSATSADLISSILRQSK